MKTEMKKNMKMYHKKLPGVINTPEYCTDFLMRKIKCNNLNFKYNESKN